MFRLEAELELMSEAEGSLLTPPNIEYRGYKLEPPVGVTGEFLRSNPLSVSDISGWCPVHRDLYLRKIKKARTVDTSKGKSWARYAGPLIQEFLEECYMKHRMKRTPEGIVKHPRDLRRSVWSLLEDFRSRPGIGRRFSTLSSKISSRFDLDEARLRELLFRSGIVDMFDLGGALRYARSGEHGPRRTLSSLRIGVSFNPAKHLKVSSPSTPDLVIPKFKAIGDMKSGDIKPEHFLSVAGYALAYESRVRTDMNVGVIYLVGTRADLIGSSQTVLFWITDELRGRFLLRRDKALSTLKEGSAEPEVLSEAQQIDVYCKPCAFWTVCHLSAESGVGTVAVAPESESAAEIS